jgi:hypothetical protein
MWDPLIPLERFTPLVPLKSRGADAASFEGGRRTRRPRFTKADHDDAHTATSTIARGWTDDDDAPICDAVACRVIA